MQEKSHFSTKTCVCQKKAVSLQPQRFEHMKKSKLFLLVALCGMVLTSCQINSPDCYYHKEVINRVADPNGWKYDPDMMQFFYRFELPEINSRIYDYGQWAVYCEINPKTNHSFQAVLPVSRFYADTTETEVTNYYTQYIDYRIGIGYVDIQLTNSDHLYAPEKPESMFFRLQANEEIIDLTVDQADWNFDENLKQYYCHILVPEITSEIYNYGVFTICREFESGTKNAYQVPLPTSLFLSETIPAKTPIYYSQQLDYVVGHGYLDVQLTNSDYYYGEDGSPIPPEPMHFRIVLTY